MDILSSSQKTLITARGDFYIIYAAMTKTSDDPGGSVAAWLSEKVLRGRGPDSSGFESHRRGRIFSKEGTSAGPWMCVYVSSGLTVGWWKEESTLFRPPPRGQHGFESRREGRPWVYKCCCVCL
jgi:hypothetical protein